MSTQPKKTRYISINFDELDKLQQSGFEAQALYLILKRLADFKTGILGKFHRQKITYATLAEQLSRPSSQGKEARIFDRSQVSRLLDQLEAAGLVDERNSAKERLTLRLPLSPISGAEAATPDAARDKAEAKKMARDEKLPPAGKPLLAADFGDPFDNLSVLTPTESINTFFINTDQAPKAPDPGARNSADAAASPPSPHMGGEIETGAALTIPRIQVLLREAGVVYIDTPISKEFYDRWIKHGISEAKLRREIEASVAFNAAPTRPGDLDRFLIPPVNRPVPRSNGGRGQVSL